MSRVLGSAKTLGATTKAFRELKEKRAVSRGQRGHSRAKETTLSLRPVLGQYLSAVADCPRTSGKTQPVSRHRPHGGANAGPSTRRTTWCRDPVQYPRKRLGHRSLHHVSNGSEGNFAIKKHQIHSFFSVCVAGFISPLMSQLPSAHFRCGSHLLVWFRFSVFTSHISVSLTVICTRPGRCAATSGHTAAASFQ